MSARRISTRTREQADATVRILLDEALGLGDMARALEASSPLLGALPELDSMAIMSVIAGIEQHCGIVIDDGEVTAETFATFGSLRDFVAARLDVDGVDAQPLG